VWLWTAVLVETVSLEENGTKQYFCLFQWYQCDTSSVPHSIRQRFLHLGVDKETELFLDQSCHKSGWIFTQLWHSIAKAFLGWFMTQTSING
jgi:hypothetical protein